MIEAFMRHLIQRYGAEEVRKWPFEVWNEPNLDGFWYGRSATKYVTILKGAYPAVKNADPAASVVLGGPSLSDTNWLSAVYAAGAAGSRVGPGCRRWTVSNSMPRTVARSCCRGPPWA